MITGQTLTLTTGEEPKVVTLTLGVSEVERLREALRQVRPIGHDYLCEVGHDGPDLWIDERNDPPIDPSTPLRALKWVQGVGLVDDGPALPEEPYVGWCCSKSTARQIIDAALKDDARS